MDTWSNIALPVVIAVLASTGFWTFIQRISEKKDIRTQMLIGLGHDRIVYLGLKYIERGWISADEYENLYEYLYKPYEKLGGNGSAKRIMEQVQRLPPHDPKEVHDDK